MDTVDALKEQAGIAACEFVKSGMKVGLGTGSTVKYTVIELGRMIKEEGLESIFSDSGFEIRQPGCSACLGMNDDKIPAGELCVSTSNRNFEGRQGPGSRTILSSPIIAAATAIHGKIVDINNE